MRPRPPASSRDASPGVLGDGHGAAPGHGRTLVVFTLLPLLQLQPERSGRTLHSSPSRQGSIWHHHFCSTMEAGTRGAVSAAWFGLTAWGGWFGGAMGHTAPHSTASRSRPRVGQAMQEPHPLGMDSLGSVPLGWLCTALPLLMGAAFDPAAFEASHWLSLSPRGKISEPCPHSQTSRGSSPIPCNHSWARGMSPQNTSLCPLLHCSRRWDRVGPGTG